MVTIKMTKEGHMWEHKFLTPYCIDCCLLRLAEPWLWTWISPSSTSHHVLRPNPIIYQEVGCCIRASPWPVPEMNAFALLLSKSHPSGHLHWSIPKPPNLLGPVHSLAWVMVIYLDRLFTQFMHIYLCAPSISRAILTLSLIACSLRNDQSSQIL